MYNALNGTLFFLINTLFDLYLFVLIIRLLLVWVRTDYYHPLTQFVVKLTQKIIVPLRRVIPNFHGVEVATLALILVLECLKFLIIGFLTVGMPNLGGIILLAIADAFRLTINIFFYSILIQVILSWVQPHSPMVYILDRLTSPLMAPIQRVVPPIAGFDISPVFALIFLQALNIGFIAPLMTLGTDIAFG